MLLTVALSHEDIGGHPERITKINPFTGREIKMRKG